MNGSHAGLDAHGGRAYNPARDGAALVSPILWNTPRSGWGMRSRPGERQPLRRATGLAAVRPCAGGIHRPGPGSGQFAVHGASACERGAPAGGRGRSPRRVAARAAENRTPRVRFQQVVGAIVGREGKAPAADIEPFRGRRPGEPAGGDIGGARISSRPRGLSAREGGIQSERCISVCRSAGQGPGYLAS